jgi:hypothetical protein
MFVLSIFGTIPAQAATKPIAVTAAFKNLLNTVSDSLDALEKKYESDVDALDNNLLIVTKAADDSYSADLLAATNLFTPQIAAATKKSDDARTTYEANNKVTLTTGFFGENDRLNWSLNCLPARQTEIHKMLKKYCAAVIGIPTFPESGYGYEDWQKGDITTISLQNADDKYVAIGIQNGYIIPQNLLAFDTGRILYKQGIADVAALTASFGKARSSAKDKRDSKVASAESTRTAALADLDNAYESAKSELADQESAANLALLAAKRASKDVASFDSAFVIAYKFEYNHKMIGEIADAAWTGEWTFRTIDSILKVNKLAATGDYIGSKYSKTQAAAFNSAVGNAFTNEPNFRAALKVLTATYKRTTSTTLRF